MERRRSETSPGHVKFRDLAIITCRSPSAECLSVRRSVRRRLVDRRLGDARPPCDGLGRPRSNSLLDGRDGMEGGRADRGLLSATD